ncbi:MAG: hypothetical protein AAGJ79_00800 [Verrucomicrobiota bacterium]
MSSQYKVAISYSGNNREYVRCVCQELAEFLFPDQIFYDELHAGLIYRPNAEKFFRETYESNADLIAVFLSEEYDDSVWCQIERNAISRKLDAGDANVILFSFGEFQGGNFRLDAAKNVDQTLPQECASLIIQNISHREGNPLKKRPRPWSAPSILKLLLLIAPVAALSGASIAFPDQTYWGPLALGAFLLSLILLFTTGRKRPDLGFSELVTNPTGHDAADKEPQAQIESLTQMCYDWESYAQAREAEFDARTTRLQNSLKQQRSLLRSSVIVMLAYVGIHVVSDFWLKKEDMTFLRKAPGTLENLWAALAQHSGHFALWGIYAAAAGLICLTMSRIDFSKSKTFIFGFIIPFLVGLISLATLFTEDYQKYFDDQTVDNPDAFLGELGNVLLLERLLVIPALCCLAVHLIQRLTPRPGKARTG